MVSTSRKMMHTLAPRLYSELSEVHNYTHTYIRPVVTVFTWSCAHSTCTCVNSLGVRICERYIRIEGCEIREGLFAYINMVTVPHKMVRLERMSDY